MLTAALSEGGGVKFAAGGEWAYNLKKKTLTYNPIDLQNMPPELIKGLLIHESGHILETHETPATAIEKQFPSVHDLHNAFEDIRIEERQKERYGEFATSSLNALNTTIGKNIYIRLDEERKKENKTMSPFELASLGVAAHAANIQYRENILNQIYYINPDVYGAIQNNFDAIEDAAKETRAAQSTREVKKIVDEKIVPIVRKFLDKNEQSHSAKIPAGQIAGKKNGTGPDKAQTCPTYEEASAIVAPYAHVLAHRLAQILAENAQPRYTGRYKSGKLRGGRVVDVCIGNERPFVRKGNSESRAYKFMIALDQSGSMEGEKSVNSYLTTVMLALVSNKLGFPFQAIAFDNEITVYEKQKDLGNYGKRLGGSTQDIKAVRYIDKQTTNGDGSIVFIIGDGAGSSRSELDPYFTSLKKKQAHVFGIGLDSEQVVRQYPNAVNVKNPQELTAAIIKKIQSIIHRQVIT